MRCRAPGVLLPHGQPRRVMRAGQRQVERKAGRANERLLAGRAAFNADGSAAGLDQCRIAFEDQLDAGSVILISTTTAATAPRAARSTTVGGRREFDRLRRHTWR